jgi:hypothetical protein
MQTNYPPFCDYSLSSQTNLTDPDVIKYCFQVQLAVLQYSPLLFWNYKDFRLIYETAIRTLATINEKFMQKMVMFFMETLVLQSITFNRTNCLDYMLLLKTMFNCMPQLNPLTFVPCSRILINVFGLMTEPPQFVLQNLFQESQCFRVFP